MERKKRRVISEECKQKVVELRKSGLTYKEIAQLCGLYRGDHARQICEKAGFLKTSAEMRDEQIIALRKDGLLYDEISEMLNVPKNIVQRVCNTNGLSYSREEQNKVAHNWAVNHYYDSSVEKIKNRIPDYIEYIGGYEGNDGYVKVKCKNCGTEFERSVQTVRKTGITYCPVCRERETEKNREERELIKNAKRIERETEREERLKQAEAERIKKTVDRVCRVCGKTFKTWQNKKCCSAECSQKYADNKRDYRIPMNKRISVGITAKSLYKRDNGTCWICGGKCDLNDYVTRDGAFIAGDWYPSVDHIVPIVDGGEHSWENVKLAHRICNSRRYWSEKYALRS